MALNSIADSVEIINFQLEPCIFPGVIFSCNNRPTHFFNHAKTYLPSLYRCRGSRGKETSELEKFWSKTKNWSNFLKIKHYVPHDTYRLPTSLHSWITFLFHLFVYLFVCFSLSVFSFNRNWCVEESDGLELEKFYKFNCKLFFHHSG